MFFPGAWLVLKIQFYLNKVLCSLNTIQLFYYNVETFGGFYDIGSFAKSVAYICNFYVFEARSCIIEIATCYLLLSQEEI